MDREACVKRLSRKHARFVASYLVDLNGTKAAIAAGYSEKGADVQSVRLLANASVREAIQQGQQKRLDAIELRGLDVLRELQRVGFSDIRQLFDEEGHLRPIHELPPTVAACLGSVEILRQRVTRKTDGELETETHEHVVKLKLWDKVKALDLLARHFGLITERHEHMGPGGGPIQTKVIFGGRYKK